MNAMYIWVYDAQDPGNLSGVCGEERRARKVVSEFLADGKATTATIESASLALGGGRAETCYERTGHGWTARRNKDGRVVWRRLTEKRGER